MRLIEIKLRSEFRDHVYNLVGDRVRSQIWDKVWTRVWNRARNPGLSDIIVRVFDEVGNCIRGVKRYLNEIS
jgi:hypothetical protein